MTGFVGSLALTIMLLVIGVWQGGGKRRMVGSVVLSVLIACCGMLVVYGLFFGEVGRPRLLIERLVEPVVLPLFMMLPAMVAFCLAQWLRRRARSVRYARVVAAVAGTAACVVTPFGAVAAGCGLAGVCF